MANGRGGVAVKPMPIPFPCRRVAVLSGAVEGDPEPRPLKGGEKTIKGFDHIRASLILELKSSSFHACLPVGVGWGPSPPLKLSPRRRWMENDRRTLSLSDDSHRISLSPYVHRHITKNKGCKLELRTRNSEVGIGIGSAKLRNVNKRRRFAR